MKFSIQESNKVMNGKINTCKGPEGFEKVFIDSREAVNFERESSKEESIAFFAIVGEVHDAHKFVNQVIDGGCCTLILSEENVADAAALYAEKNQKNINKSLC